MKTPFPVRASTVSPVLGLGLAMALAAAVSSCAGGGLDDDIAPPPVTIPDEPVVIADVRPPPISGGSLVVSNDGKLAYVADPDRDRFLAFDLTQFTVRANVALLPGDEPGRLVEDGAGLVHIAARRSGDVITIDPVARKVVDRRHVCPAPRGIAFDPARGVLHVACVGGELVTMGASPRTPIRRTLRLDPDLRDVLVQGDRLFVTRFRSAELLVIDAEGNLVHRETLAAEDAMVPAVAWRTIGLPGGGAFMVHQRSSRAVLPESPTPVYYNGSGCFSSVVDAAVTHFDADGHATSVGSGVVFSVLPVDLAVSADSQKVAIVSPPSGTVRYVAPFDLPQLSGCIGDPSHVEGEPIAAAFTPAGHLVVLSREPSAITIDGEQTFNLGGDSRADSGHKLFHGDPENASPSIVCASCHPEGRDDGHTFFFGEDAPRRSMPLLGSVMETAPFHWTGDLGTLDALMSDVFVRRMRGQPQTPERVAALGGWLEQLPAIPASPPADPGAVERGKELFEDAAVGCESCHSGPQHTNGTNADVGTRGTFQVPRLVGLAYGGPYMHDGCATTLRDRFTNELCGGGDLHGHTSQLSSAQIDDLVAYLETL